jgi:hypothetical protein
MLQIGPLRDNRSEFDNMAAAALSSSFRADLEHGLSEMERPRVDLAPFRDRLQKHCPSTLLDVFLTIPIWSSAVLSLTVLPALVRLAPLYSTLIIVSITIVRIGKMDEAKSGEWWGLFFLSFLSVLLSASIFILGLQIDGTLNSPITVAALFGSFVASIGFGILFVMVWGFDRAECWRTTLGMLAWTLAMCSALLAIVALLAKTMAEHGTLSQWGPWGHVAVIPYWVIIFVMLTVLPGCGCIGAVMSFYV